MFAKLQEITRRPAPFETYSAKSLWADPHRAQQMLTCHLDGSLDMSSRKTAFIDLSSAWIVDRFALGLGKSVCDFGCGPGLYTSRLARSGAEVTGLDFSENSLRYARAEAAKAGQEIDYIQADYLALDLNRRFDLITLIMCDFCALGPAQRARLLGIFHAHLKDDGALLFDVYSMAAFHAREEACFYEKNQLNHFWAQEEYFCFVNIFKYEAEAVMLDKYSIFRAGGGGETVYNWLQYFSVARVTEELAAAGFTLDALYGDVAGRPASDEQTEFAIVARKAR